MFSTGGDGFGAAFARAGDAVAAALEAQRRLVAEPWPAGAPMRVRMGLHTGEAERARRGLFRHGGEPGGPADGGRSRRAGAVLGRPRPGWSAPRWRSVDLGEHRLRDLSGATRLFQVRAEGSGRVPAAAFAGRGAGEPARCRSTSFVGRDAEVAELAGLVRAHRLVTLTGVGGVGKTRLALQVAAELVGEFPDGVWLVELAPVGDPAAVADAVATVLGVTPQAGVTRGRQRGRGVVGPAHVGGGGQLRARAGRGGRAGGGTWLAPRP